jgi:hypothetical protein
MTVLQDLTTAGRSALSAFRATWAGLAPRRAQATNHRIADCHLPLSQRYFVTTDRGLYRIEPDGLFKLLDLPLYGIAADDRHLYLALMLGRRSVLVRGALAPFLGGGGSPRFEEILTVDLNSTNERLHALWLGSGDLWVANTARNSLLRISRDDLSDREEFVPFSDRFGHRLLHDINHINGISEYEGIVLFSAYRAGKQALIGVLDGKDVTGYGYPNVGIHDIYLGGKGFAFCDTFGPAGAAGRGAVITAEGLLDAEYFNRGAGYVVRGLAGNAGELLIGHSHKGNRRQRFGGHGSLLLACDGRIVGEQGVEAAQVYQIMTCTGEFLGPRPVAVSAEGIHRMLRQQLGAPVYQAEALALPASSAIPQGLPSADDTTPQSGGAA